MPRTALIIGAGPAGLTAAHELLARTDVRPIVLEQSDQVGGISRTVRHGGNRIDIGGHRFFSKSDRVMDWWFDRLPLQALPPGTVQLAYQRQGRGLDVAGVGPDPHQEDAVMLLRSRRSRIFHGGQFFSYPLSLELDTFRALGLARTARIGASYGAARLRPRPENNLEDFLINRFGGELYRTFFRDYTAKVWGRPCEGISAEWGAQRIKGLSLRAALADGIGRRLGRRDADTETSLIEQFCYPKFGPGQMWETVADEVQAGGGEVRLGWRVVGLLRDGARVTGVEAIAPDGTRHALTADLVYSTMPVQGLVRGLAAHGSVPDDVRDVAAGLEYRDFITVGLLLDRLAVSEPDGGRILDNWIYIQEPDVHVGRMQIFNNWSPWMVADAATTWVGLEYFANEGDALWTRSDADLAALGERELVQLGLADEGAVRDGVVIRMKRAYPGYFGAYERFGVVRKWLDSLDGLVPLGRNGLHRYNNQDHSMLTAMVAVDNLLEGRRDRSNLWAVNTEDDYHEGGSS
jgi:protoporphyrinogen oxidase